MLFSNYAVGAGACAVVRVFGCSVLETVRNDGNAYNAYAVLAKSRERLISFEA